MIWVFLFCWLSYFGVQNSRHDPFENLSLSITSATKINNLVAPRVLIVERKYDVGQTCHVNFVRYIVENEGDQDGTFENSETGDHEIVVQTGWFDRNKLGPRKDIINIPILSAYPQGHYTLYTHYSYNCNALDTIFPRSLLEKTAEFDIIPNQKKPPDPTSN
jgi:hypothetical protein